MAKDRKVEPAALGCALAAATQRNYPASNGGGFCCAKQGHRDPAARNGREAIDLAERACKLTDCKQPLVVGTVAAVCAEPGRFAEAVTAAEKARTLAEHTNQIELANRNRALLELYRSGQPARDNAP